MIMKKGTSDIISKYFQDIEKFEIMQPEFFNFLVNQIKNGDEAAKDFAITHNLKLVVFFAKKEYQKYNSKIPLEDIIQEGNLGLIKAIEHFNPEKGRKFSTYAEYWIKQYITRLFENTAYTIRLPVHVHGALSKLRKAEHILTQLDGTKPTLEELSDFTGIPVDKVNQYLNHKRDPISMDTTYIINNEEIELGSVIEDTTAENPEEITEMNGQKFYINKVIGEVLNEKEENIIRLRYGLDTLGNRKTLTEIADIFGLTRERIRQIQKQAEEKLRVHLNKKMKISAEII